MITANDYMLECWETAQRAALKRWSGSIHNTTLTLDDIRDIATDVVVELAHKVVTWPEPPSIPGFVTMAKQRIEWQVLEELNKSNKTRDLDDFGDARTQLTKFRPPSLLHKQLVDRIALFPTRRKLLLALRFYEDIETDRIGEIMDVEPANVPRDIRTATKYLLRFALSEVVTDPAEAPAERSKRWDVPESVHQWVWRNYGTDVYSYLGYVQREYALDVTYMVDLIDNAHGVRRVAKSANDRRAKVTPEQAAEILSRALAGEPKERLALAYGVSLGTLSKYLRGAGVRYRRNAGIDDEVKAAVARALRDGEPKLEIAARLGISLGSVWDVADRIK